MDVGIMKLRGLVHSKYQNEAALAKTLGWSRQKLNKLTTGKKDPDLYELNALSQGLETDVQTLLEFFLPSKSPIRQLKDIV